MKKILSFFILLSFGWTMACPPPATPCNSSNSSQFQDCIEFENSGAAVTNKRTGTLPSGTSNAVSIRFSELKTGPSLASVQNIQFAYGDATTTYNAFAGDYVSIFTIIDATSQGASKVFFQLEAAGQYVEFVYSPPIPAGTSIKTIFKIPPFITSGQITAKLSIEGTVAGIYSNTIHVKINVVSEDDMGTPPTTQTITTVNTTLTMPSLTTTSQTTVTTQTTITSQTSSTSLTSTTITTTITTSTVTTVTTTCQSILLNSVPTLDGRVTAAAVSDNSQAIDPLGDTIPNIEIRLFYSFDISSIPPSSIITDATLSLYRTDSGGTPTDLGNVTIDHVDYGTTLDTGDFAVTALQSFATFAPLVPNNWHTWQVGFQISNDLGAARTRTQYRLKTGSGTDNDGVADFTNWTMNENGSNIPSLTVTYCY